MKKKTAVYCSECGWVYLEDVEVSDFNDDTREITFKCKYCNTNNISKTRGEE